MGAGAMFSRMLKAELRSMRWISFTFLVLLVVVLTAITLPILLDENKAVGTAAKALLLDLHFPLVPGSFILALHAIFAGAERGSSEWDSKTAVLLYSQPVSPFSLFVAQSGAVWVGQAISVLVACLGGLVAGLAVGLPGVASAEWWLVAGGILFGLLPLCVMGTLLGVTRRKASSAMFLGFAVVALFMPVAGAASAGIALADSDFKDLGKDTREMRAMESNCFGSARAAIGLYETAVQERTSEMEARYATAAQELEAAKPCSERIYGATDAFYRQRGVLPKLHSLQDVTYQLASARALQLGQPEPQRPARLEEQGYSDGEIANIYAGAYASKFDDIGVQWSRYLNGVGLLSIGESWTGHAIVKEGVGSIQGQLLLPAVVLFAYGDDATAFDVVPANAIAASTAVVLQTALWLGLAALSLKRRDLV